MKILRLLLFAGLWTIGAGKGRGCDLCGCYTPQLNATKQTESAHLPEWAKGLYGAIAEQFTDFGTLQLNGDEIDNPTGQYLNSSITQLVIGYDLTSRFALQLNVPVIYREFKRPEGLEVDRGTESGFGDLSVSLKTILFQYSSPAGRTYEFVGKNPVAVEHESKFTASAGLLLGFKFPTAATDPGASDFVEQTALRYKNLFFEGIAQFTLRGDGAHEYHFANDFTWAGGPGYYFVRNNNTVAGIQF